MVLSLPFRLITSAAHLASLTPLPPHWPPLCDLYTSGTLPLQCLFISSSLQKSVWLVPSISRSQGAPPPHEAASPLPCSTLSITITTADTCHQQSPPSVTFAHPVSPTKGTPERATVLRAALSPLPEAVFSTWQVSRTRLLRVNESSQLDHKLPEDKISPRLQGTKQSLPCTCVQKGLNSSDSPPAPREAGASTRISGKARGKQGDSGNLQTKRGRLISYPCAHKRLHPEED